MPFYSYHCSECNHRFELQRSVDQRDNPAICPECESGKISRMLSMPSLYSKSSGGEVSMIGGGASGCGGCTATSCGGCGVKN